jgi:hypothetical protein
MYKFVFDKYIKSDWEILNKYGKVYFFPAILIGNLIMSPFYISHYILEKSGVINKLTEIHEEVEKQMLNIQNNK